MESFMPKGLRKGAWTDEEDDLLRKYILKFGEGRWHQVSMRTGLNRCRKSCRMRWLNYLKPGIKRGDLEEDEVDLLLKLHKLLGNRWSLISGRLPGRTANDIKNYWNTHLKKNKQGRQQKSRKKMNAVKTTVVKPFPRTLFRARPWVWKKKDRINNSVSTRLQHTASTCSDVIQDKISCSELIANHESDTWWERLLFDEELDRAMSHW